MMLSCKYNDNIFLIIIAILLLSVIFLSCGMKSGAYAQTQPQLTLKTQHIPAQAPGVKEISAQPDLASKKVLILHSFAHYQPGDMIIDTSLVDSFVAKGLDFNNLYFEFMDLARNPGQKYRSQLLDHLREKYAKHKMDIVITLHNEALQFLVNNARDVFPVVPVISILSPTTFEKRDPKRPEILLPFSIDVHSTVKSILKLQPDTRKLVIIAGSNSADSSPDSGVKVGITEQNKEVVKR